ncbi:hypothetical protein Sjap_002093 [Stephania japonica]|uniref:Uncharacterized protein n=1 Tax=Stephania japonica TaxID=461633 RepID=A0AAP0PS68_9MAGN
MKTPWSSSNSVKMKTLVHSQVFQHLCQVLKTLAKAKSLFMQLLNKNNNKGTNNNPSITVKKMKMKKKKKQLFINSFRLHYNWCSSHVLPMPDSVVGEGFGGAANHDYYDSTWNAVVPAEEFQQGLDSQLSGYLHWLEEKGSENCVSNDQGDVDEINKLAEKFIQSCHEKFRLEKQESYRRYQEMLARGL